MKFQNCGVTVDNNVFLQVESYSKYDDIIPVGTVLKGTSDMVPNTAKEIHEYVVRWISNGMLPITFDANDFWTRFVKGYKDEMAMLMST